MRFTLIFNSAVIQHTTWQYIIKLYNPNLISIIIPAPNELPDYLPLAQAAAKYTYNEEHLTLFLQQPREQ